MAEQELSIVIRARNAAKDALAEIDRQFKGLDVSVADVSASLNQAGNAMATLQRVDQTLLAGSADHFMLIQQSLEQVQVSANSTEAGLKQLDESSTELAATAINTSQQVVIAFTNIEQAGMSSAENINESASQLTDTLRGNEEALTVNNEAVKAVEEAHRNWVGTLEKTALAITAVGGIAKITNDHHLSWLGTIGKTVVGFGALALAVNTANKAGDGWIKTLANVTIEFTAVSAAISAINTLSGGMVFSLAAKAAEALGISLVSLNGSMLLVSSGGWAAQLAIKALNLILEAGVWVAQHYALTLGLVAGAVASAMAAIWLISEAMEHMAEAAKFEDAITSIENMAQSYGESSKEIASALQEASQGVLSFAEALKLVPTTLDKDLDVSVFVNAMKIASAESKLTGETITTVYNRIANDFHNGTIKAVEAANGIIDLDKAYKHFAEVNGQLADDLTDTGKKIAALEANIIAHGQIVNKLGTNYLSANETLKKWGGTMADIAGTLWQTFAEKLVQSLMVVNIGFNALVSTGGMLAEVFFRLIGATKLATISHDLYVNSLDDIKRSWEAMSHLGGKMEELDRPTKALFNSTARLAKEAEEAGKKLDEAFSTLGVVRVEKEIEKLEEAYQTLESSGKASSTELAQAHDNLLKKIKELRNEIDPIAEAYKTLGFQGSKEVEEGLDKMRSAYKTLRDSGVASAGDIAQAWQAVETKQKEVADKVDVYAAILKDKIVPAATAYASALAESGKAEVAALKSGLDARFTQVADAAKNAGKSIEGINTAMANKFDTARKATDDLAKAMSDLRSATNAYANDLDRVGNEQYLQYQKLIQSQHDYGVSADQIRQAEIIANKNYKSLVEARIDAERGGLAELVKIRDQNLNNYKQHKEDIKQIDQAISDARKYADDVRAAVSDKGFTTEEKNLRELNRLKAQLSDSELLEGERRLQIIRQIEQKAGQIATSSQVNSMEEIRGMALVNEASEKEVALLIQIKDEHETAAKSAVRLAKNTDLAIAKSQELVSGLQEVVRALGQTIADSDLAVKIKLLDEAMEPAKKLKDELKTLYRDDIIQKIRIVKTQPGGNNTGDLTNTDNSTDSNTVDYQFGEPSIPGFATGISYVPRDMVARIHQGETVLNKQDAERYRSGQIGNVTFGDIHINVPPGVPITRAVVMEIRRELARIDKRVS